MDGGAERPSLPGSAGRFVVIGEGVVVSENAADWRSVAAPAAKLRAAAVSGSRLVVIDAAGRAYVSTDLGETWSSGAAALPLEKEQSVDVTWDGQTFIAVSGGWDGGASATSPDGLTWTAIVAPSNHMFDLAFRTPGGARATSHHRSDRMTPGIWELKAGAWTPAAPPSAGSEPVGLLGATYATELARTFAVSGSAVFDTADGKTWSSHEVSGIDGFRLRAIASNGDRLVTVGEAGGSWSSADRGATWSRADVEGGGFYASIAYGNGLFVAAGRTQTSPSAKAAPAAVARTADGATWQRAILPGVESPAAIVFVTR